MKIYTGLMILFTFSHAAQAQPCTFVGALLKNPGKLQKVYPTINQAVRNSILGGEILIGSGTAAETVNIVSKDSLTVSSDCEASIERIVLKKSRNITISNLLIKPAKGHAIQIVGGEDANAAITLKNLNLEPKYYGDTAHGIHIGETTQGVDIEDSTVRGFPNSGIFIENLAKEIEISRSTIEGNLRHGIVAREETDLSIQDSRILRNGKSSLTSKSSGFGLAISKSPASKIEVRRSEIAFNFGCMERSYACDISNPSFLTTAEAVSTTYGREKEGIQSLIKGTAGTLNQPLEDYLDQTHESIRFLLRAFVTHAIFATKSTEKVNKGYASIREVQLKTCMNARVPEGIREKVIDILDIASGKNVNTLLPFIARYDDAKMVLPNADVPDNVCRGLDRTFR